MEWMLGVIANLLTMSPAEFSPAAFGLAQTIGVGLAPFAVYIMILLWGIDFIGSTINFSEKPLETLIRMVVMLGFGLTFTRISFWLVMGLFQIFGGIITGIGDITGLVDFSVMTESTLEMIDARSGLGYNMGTTENMIFFVFLVFTLLSFFGMFLGMILVPVAIFVELYVYAAFSPIPIATLFTGQKQVGIAFIKLVIAVCLRGAVVLFGIHIAAGVIASGILVPEGLTLAGFWQFLTPIITISISIMILQKCIKGAADFAKNITGASSGGG